MSAPVVIGPVYLQGFEVPEHIDGLGGTHSTALHEFPGGVRSLQLFGAFPKMLEWQAILSGPIAFARAVELDRLRVTGVPVQFSYGPFAYLCVVVSFEAKPKSQWLIPYSISFLPVVDQGAASSLGPDINSADLLAAQELNVLAALLNPANPLMALASELEALLSGLITQTKSSLSSSQGYISNIDSQTVAANLATMEAFIAAASPYAQQTSSLSSSPALDAITHVTVLIYIFQQPSFPKYQVVAINPNLGRLAQQYYGDSSQWRVIAAANNLNDIQPIGEFTLVIPQGPQ